MIFGYFDWPAMAILMSAYLILARQPRAGALLLGIADVFWTIFAVVDGQLPLLIVSVWCGAFSLYTFLKWRDPKVEPEADPPPRGGASLHDFGRAIDYGTTIGGEPVRPERRAA